MRYLCMFIIALRTVMSPLCRTESRGIFARRKSVLLLYYLHTRFPTSANWYENRGFSVFFRRDTMTKIRFYSRPHHKKFSMHLTPSPTFVTHEQRLDSGAIEMYSKYLRV